MNIAPPPVIDGNVITLHTRQGVSIIFDFLDDAKQPLSMVGRTVYFRTSFGSSIQLTAGTAANQLILTFPVGSMNATLGQMSTFAILDETNSLHELIWQGYVNVRGWVA